jgi:ribose 5-phosphate isomerase B
MNIAFACDHGGFPLRGAILDAIRRGGHTPVELGSEKLQPGDDYPDYAAQVGRAILDGRAERGILVCGSGVGASIAANKIRGIYAAICHDLYSARQGVEHDEMNVLCLGARVINQDVAQSLVWAFLEASFSGEERHLRRVNKVRQMETDSMGKKE